MAGRATTDSIIKGRCAISVNNPGHPSPPGWARVPLTDIAELGTGHTPSRLHPEYWDGDVPWIGIRDAGAHHGGTIHQTAQHVTALGLANSAARLHSKDTVCLSRTASVGYVVKLGQPMATSQDFVTWSCSEALDPDYLMRALLAEGQDIRRFGEGSTHTTIYFPEVKAFNIDLPPLAEQGRISAKLDVLTGRIARTRAQLARVPALVRHLKQQALSVCFSAPPGCSSVLLGNILKGVQAGKNLRCEERPPHPGELGVVKVSAVTWGRFDPTKAKTLPADYTPPETAKIRAGDLLMSRANTIEFVGSVAIVEDAPRDLFLSDKVLRLVVPEDAKRWVQWFLRSPSGREQIERMATGNQLSMRNLSQDALRRIELPFPDAAIRLSAVHELEAAFARAERLKSEAARVTKLLDLLEASVLAKAFRGELVPQDPADEPVAALLDRVRAERAAAPNPKRGRRAPASGE